jgi:hypothetical protein
VYVARATVPRSRGLGAASGSRQRPRAR